MIIRENFVYVNKDKDSEKHPLSRRQALDYTKWARFKLAFCRCFVRDKNTRRIKVLVEKGQERIDKILDVQSLIINHKLLGSITGMAFFTKF